MKLALLALVCWLPSCVLAASSRVETLPTTTVSPVPSLAPALSPALAQAPGVAPGLAPALAAAVAPVPALPPAAVAGAAPAVARPGAVAPTAAPNAAARAPAPGALGALQATGAALDAAHAQPAPAGAAQEAASVAALYGDGAHGGAPGEGSVSVGAGAAAAFRSSGLAPARAPTQRARRAMPPGVKDAFQKAALMTTTMGGMLAGLWPVIHHAAPQASPLAYGLTLLPLSLLLVHFTLVGGFWAGRYYLYPKLGTGAQRAFAAGWRAVAVAYPIVATAGLAWWVKTAAASPTLLGALGLAALFAAGEVSHHFVWRIVPERAQDRGKPWTDADSRRGGNIGRVLRQLRAKPAR